MTGSRQIFLVLRTLAIGGCGAVVFSALGLPAAYMSGALIAVATCAVLGIEVYLPVQVRNAAFFCTGIFFGSTVDQETVRSLTAWPFSLMALAASLVSMMTLIPLYLRRVHGYDRETAVLASVPGALSFVLALALERGADVRRITIVQTSRLALLIVALPIGFGLFSEIKPLGVGAETILGAGQVAMLFLIAALSIPLAILLKIPAPFFSGPFFAVGSFFGAGQFEGALPAVILWPALAALGTAIGSRFAGIDLNMLKTGAVAGFGSTAIGLTVAGILAAPVSYFLSLPPLQVWLAFAPGGIDALTIVAFSLGADPAFVAGHQMLRFVGLSLCLPFAAKWLGLSGEPSGGEDEA